MRAGVLCARQVCLDRIATGPPCKISLVHAQTNVGKLLLVFAGGIVGEVREKVLKGTT